MASTKQTTSSSWKRCQRKVYLAGARALRIIDKICTGPFYRLLSEVDNILELNPHLEKMRSCFEKWADDSSSLLFNQEIIFDDNIAEVHRDDLFFCLFDSDDIELNILTQQALEIIFHTFVILLERQGTDQLPCRKYWQPSEQLKKQAANVPTTNVVSERDFAVFDMLI